MSDKKPMHPDTKLVLGGRRKEWLRGMVNVPVSRTSTILFDSVEEIHAAYPPEDGRLSYGRNGTWTQWSLAEALTDLEPGAAGTRLFPSGSAAVSIALTSVLGPGDELLMVDSAYGPTRHFCDRELKRLGIATRYYDPVATPEELEAMISDKTRAIFMESPGSLTFEVQDVPAICAMAKKRGLTTLLDNTWATSFFFPAIAKGVDLAIVACTKYISGHSDLMMGAVTAAPSHWERLSRTGRSFGQYVSPDDAYLAARGLRTLGVRLRQHELGAVKVAHWLKDQPQVERIIHPAFADCPGHEFWRRDFLGSSGLFGFALKGGGDAARDRLVESLELFGIGYSWGGFESLAVPAEPDPIRTASKRDYGGPLVRLHVGLEDPDDLIADLAQALAIHPAS
ncbi:cystathionine beta-lyase [Sphingomonas sediminicola]|uniref:cystathionine beta-lyase n=1 Tax=Sphingomonas sediminicola TaxID=386874 RepID=UPI003CF4C309